MEKSPIKLFSIKIFPAFNFIFTIIGWKINLLGKRIKPKKEEESSQVLGQKISGGSSENILTCNTFYYPPTVDIRVPALSERSFHQFFHSISHTMLESNTESFVTVASIFR